MGNNATIPHRAAGILAVGLAAAVLGWPQSAPNPPIRAAWHGVGNAAVELELADLATGPVERVWYSPDGTRLLIRTSLGQTFESFDFETWIPAAEPAPPPVPGFAATSPEPDAQLRNPAGPTPRVYAFGAFVHRSDDSGRHWENLTGYQGVSIIGEGLRDLAVSPIDENEIAVAGGAGVFRSLDGGRSWHGLNQNLPNLPGARIRSTPGGDRGVRIELAGAMMLEWQPGEWLAWRPADNTEAVLEMQLRQNYSESRGALVTAVEVSGSYVYTGAADGRISVSGDGGASWIDWPVAGGGAVNAFWVDPGDPRLALAVLDSANGDPEDPRVLHTINGGVVWDDVSTNLPASSVVGVTADRSVGAVYVATAGGIYFGELSLDTLGAPATWTAVTGLPGLAAEAPVSDVLLDPSGIQLWTAVEGHGVFVTLAPHLASDPQVVSSADLAMHAAAPGSLLTVAGRRVENAAAGGYPAPVLAATDNESQIQVPFEVAGASLPVIVNGASGGAVLGPLALEETAPAISIGYDGGPLLLDAASGILLDGMHPAHTRMRVQVLATGLGRVRPDWPTGTPAPMDDPPEVIAGVRAFLDREPVEVTRAVLAPGYIGFYLVEIEIPTIVNYGAAELYIEAGGQTSNRVRVYIEP